MLVGLIPYKQPTFVPYRLDQYKAMPLFYIVILKLAEHPSVSASTAQLDLSLWSDSDFPHVEF